MKRVTIQAYEDLSRAEGGHAVILLHGVRSPKGKIAFRIRLAGHSRAEGGGGWIGGEHVPVSAAETEQGLEIIVGPGVTESELLLPSTVVEIEVPACAARGEFLWPNIAPPMRPKRKSIVSSRPRHIQPQPVRSEPVMSLKNIPAAPALPAEVATAPAYVELTVSEVTSSEAEPPAEFAPEIRVAADETVSFTAEATTAAHEQARAAHPTSVSAHEAPKMERKPAGKRSGQHAPDDHAEEIAEKYGWAFKKDLNVMLSKKFFALGDSRHDAVQDEAIHATAGSHHSIAAEVTSILAHNEEAELANQNPTYYDAPAPETHHQAAADMHGGGETFYPHARGSVVGAGHAPHGKRVPMSAGVVAALATLLVGGITAVALLSGQANVGPGNASATPAIAVTAAPRSAAETAMTQASLFDALSSGSTSPRGVNASGVTAAKALENANLHILAAGTARDTEEGAFWLKQYIGTTLGEERTVRVLTQLGSVYAEPSSGAPDYDKARQLWEIASAAGDPVAMCFLGLLHETGLGIAADKKAALQWYQRSKDKGGCPNVDQSLVRVSQ